MVSSPGLSSKRRAVLINTQPAFAAINVEPEENIEDEVDNTKEIQV